MRLDPLVLLLDAALTGELDVVQQAVAEVGHGDRGGGTAVARTRSVGMRGGDGVTARVTYRGRRRGDGGACPQLNDPSQPNDEGITALHNAICGANYGIVDFLIASGANVNSPDSHGWWDGDPLTRWQGTGDTPTQGRGDGGIPLPQLVGWRPSNVGAGGGGLRCHHRGDGNRDPGTWGQGIPQSQLGGQGLMDRGTGDPTATGGGTGTL